MFQFVIHGNTSPESNLSNNIERFVRKTLFSRPLKTRAAPERSRRTTSIVTMILDPKSSEILYKVVEREGLLHTQIRSLTQVDVGFLLFTTSLELVLSLKKPSRFHSSCTIFTNDTVADAYFTKMAFRFLLNFGLRCSSSCCIWRRQVPMLRQQVSTR